MNLMPFLELPVSLPGIEDNPDKVVSGKFQPVTISAYHPSYFGSTMIYLANGQPFLIDLTVEEYEEKIKLYFDEITAKQNELVKGSIVKPLNGKSKFHN